MNPVVQYTLTVFGLICAVICAIHQVIQYIDRNTIESSATNLEVSYNDAIAGGVIFAWAVWLCCLAFVKYFSTVHTREVKFH
jgi:hypothetical protein